MIRILK